MPSSNAILTIAEAFEAPIPVPDHEYRTLNVFLFFLGIFLHYLAEVLKDVRPLANSSYRQFTGLCPEHGRPMRSLGHSLADSIDVSC